MNSFSDLQRSIRSQMEEECATRMKMEAERIQQKHQEEIQQMMAAGYALEKKVEDMQRAYPKDLEVERQRIKAEMQKVFADEMTQKFRVSNTILQETQENLKKCRMERDRFSQDVKITKDKLDACKKEFDAQVAMLTTKLNGQLELTKAELKRKNECIKRQQDRQKEVTDLSETLANVREAGRKLEDEHFSLQMEYNTVSEELSLKRFEAAKWRQAYMGAVTPGGVLQEAAALIAIAQEIDQKYAVLFKDREKRDQERCKLYVENASALIRGQERAKAMKTVQDLQNQHQIALVMARSEGDMRLTEREERIVELRDELLAMTVKANALEDELERSKRERF